MSFAEFLEKYPLYRKTTVGENIWVEVPPAIQFDCGSCNTERTFSRQLQKGLGTPFPGRSSSPPESNNRKPRIINLTYRCGYCEEFEVVFFIHHDEAKSRMMKVGQFPPWKTSTAKNLKKLLGTHEATFSKGLICESQGFGIGAFGYYRRIVELTIDELLASISDLIQGDDKAKYDQALVRVRLTIVAQEKIDVVKDLLPASLRPSGLNPLSILHSTLSEGLHALSDEECLAMAEAVRTALSTLVNEIATQTDASKSMTDAMRKLLDRKGKK